MQKSSIKNSKTRPSQTTGHSSNQKNNMQTNKKTREAHSLVSKKQLQMSHAQEGTGDSTCHGTWLVKFFPQPLAQCAFRGRPRCKKKTIWSLGGGCNGGCGPILWGSDHVRSEGIPLNLWRKVDGPRKFRWACVPALLNIRWEVIKLISIWSCQQKTKTCHWRERPQQKQQEARTIRRTKTTTTRNPSNKLSTNLLKQFKHQTPGHAKNVGKSWSFMVFFMVLLAVALPRDMINDKALVLGTSRWCIASEAKNSRRLDRSTARPSALPQKGVRPAPLWAVCFRSTGSAPNSFCLEM